MRKEFRNLIIVFIFLFVFVYIGLLIKGVVANISLLSLIIALIAISFTYLYLKLNKEKLPKVNGKGMLRYTLLCHNCNWEWMSNTTEKEKPTTCPNCGNKNKLELIGWRKVNVLPKKGDKELSNFFKK